MNARQRKLILQRTILKRVRKPQAEKVESAQWEIVPPAASVIMVDLDWKPAEEFQSQSRLHRHVERDAQPISRMIDGPPALDWEGLKKQIAASGGIPHTALQVEMPITQEQRDECELPPARDYLSLMPFKLHDYQIEAMERIREFAAKTPFTILDYPSRHSMSMLNAIERAAHEPMILMSSPRVHDDDSVLNTLSIKMLKKRALSGEGGTFRINLENLSITDEPENNNGN